MDAQFGGHYPHSHDSAFLLTPLGGSIGLPIFLRDGMEALVGRNTFFSASPLAGKVSRCCVAVRCLRGQIYMGRCAGVTNPICFRSYSTSFTALPASGFVQLPGFAIVEFYPGSGCGFELKEQYSVARSSFDPRLSSRRLRRSFRTSKQMSCENSLVEASSICPGCYEVNCSCEQVDVGSPSVAPPAIVNISMSDSVAAAQEQASAIATEPLEERKRERIEVSDEEDGEDDDYHERKKKNRNVGVWECQKCTLMNESEDLYCKACNFDPDSHELSNGHD